jgi:hypothetical protein
MITAVPRELFRTQEREREKKKGTKIHREIEPHETKYNLSFKVRKKKKEEKRCICKQKKIVFTFEKSKTSSQVKVKELRSTEISDIEKN